MSLTCNCGQDRTLGIAKGIYSILSCREDGEEKKGGNSREQRKIKEQVIKIVKKNEERMDIKLCYNQT